MNKTLNIACTVDKWFLPLKDCNSVTLQPQMSMLSLFLTLSNMRQPEAPFSAVGDTVCPLGILKIYLPWKHASYKTQTPADVQRKFLWLRGVSEAGRLETRFESWELWQALCAGHRGQAVQMQGLGNESWMNASWNWPWLSLFSSPLRPCQVSRPAQDAVSWKTKISSSYFQVFPVCTSLQFFSLWRI